MSVESNQDNGKPFPKECKTICKNCANYIARYEDMYSTLTALCKATAKTKISCVNGEIDCEYEECNKINNGDCRMFKEKAEKELTELLKRRFSEIEKPGMFSDSEISEIAYLLIEDLHRMLVLGEPSEILCSKCIGDWDDTIIEAKEEYRRRYRK